MLFDKLSIQVTDQCSAACDICCLSCSPQGKNTLETGDMKRVIRQAAEAGGMKEICFSGGEPLLYTDRVLACAAYAAELGLQSSVFTNGFWGADEKRAAEWAAALYQAGVRRMHYSSDAWHQQYVPFQALETAMRCTREAGMRNELSIMEIRDSDHRKQAMEAMPAEYRAARVIAHPMFPLGRAKEQVGEDRCLKLFPARDARCIYDGLATLMFDGSYYLCCSMYCTSIPRVRLGHMREISFAQLEERVLSDDYLYIMLKEGFGWYLQRMRELGCEVPELVSFPCECCALVFNNDSFLEQIREEVRHRARALRQAEQQQNNEV